MSDAERLTRFDKVYPVADGHAPPTGLDLLYFEKHGHRVGGSSAHRKFEETAARKPVALPPPIPEGYRDPSVPEHEQPGAPDPVRIQAALDLFHGVVPDDHRMPGPEPAPAPAHREIFSCLKHGQSLATSSGGCPLCAIAEPIDGEELPTFANEWDDPLSPYGPPQGSQLDLSKRNVVEPSTPPDRPAGQGTTLKPKENTMSTPPPNGGTAAVAAPASAPLARAPQPIAGIAPGLGIAPARRRQGIMRVCLVSASGGGKTYTSLLMARGFLLELGLPLERRGKGVAWWNYDAQTGDPSGPARILVIDTEAGSSMDYEHLVAFDVFRIDKPYTIQRYRDGYEQAVSGGYDVLIIDSGSHLWAGSGGLREEVDVVNKNSKSKFEGWSTIGPKWEEFKSTIIVASKMHLICTFRAKSAYEIQNGKRVKVGVDPISRDEIEFEFTVGFEMTQENKAQIDKDRTGLFKDRGYFQPDEATGRELMKWRRSGAAELPIAAVLARPGALAAPSPAVQAAASAEAPTVAQRDEVKAIRTKLGLTLAEARELAGQDPATPSTRVSVDALLTYLRANVADAVELM